MKKEKKKHCLKINTKRESCYELAFRKARARESTQQLILSALGQSCISEAPRKVPAKLQPCPCCLSRYSDQQSIAICKCSHFSSWHSNEASEADKNHSGHGKKEQCLFSGDEGDMSQESLCALWGWLLSLIFPLPRCHMLTTLLVTGQLHVLLEDKTVHMHADFNVFLQHKSGDGNT